MIRLPYIVTQFISRLCDIWRNRHYSAGAAPAHRAYPLVEARAALDDDAARIRALWDALDKIHTAAHDHRHGVAGARDAARMLAYAERTAASALELVSRP